MLYQKALLTFAFAGSAFTNPVLKHPSLADAVKPKQLSSRSTATTSYFGDFTGSTSSYPDGSGTYYFTQDVGTYASGVKCWTDFFSENNEYVAEAWELLPDQIDCATASLCASGTTNGTQRCSTWSVTWGNQVKLTVSEYLDIDITENLDYTNGGIDCVTAVSTNTCSWNDQGCHALWVSDVVQQYNGYIRRRCSSSSGDYTAWSKDWTITYPSSQTRLGCGASCADTSYPDPVPPA